MTITLPCPNAGKAPPPAAVRKFPPVTDAWKLVAAPRFDTEMLWLDPPAPAVRLNVSEPGEAVTAGPDPPDTTIV